MPSTLKSIVIGPIQLSFYWTYNFLSSSSYQRRLDFVITDSHVGSCHGGNEAVLVNRDGDDVDYDVDVDGGDVDDHDDDDDDRYQMVQQGMMIGWVALHESTLIATCHISPLLL